MTELSVTQEMTETKYKRVTIVADIVEEDKAYRYMDECGFDKAMIPGMKMHYVMGEDCIEVYGKLTTMIAELHDYAFGVGYDGLPLAEVVRQKIKKIAVECRGARL